MFKEQINREKTVPLAIEELKTFPPNSNEIEKMDEDWLNRFSNLAQTKSKEDIQIVLFKIPAGEIKKPGAFDPKTLHVLSLLDQNTSKKFQLFCNLCFSIKNITAITSSNCSTILKAGECCHANNVVLVSCQL